MPISRRLPSLVLALLLATAFAPAVRALDTQLDSSRLEGETMRHFQAVLRLDTSTPSGNEGRVVDVHPTRAPVRIAEASHRDIVVRGAAAR